MYRRKKKSSKKLLFLCCRRRQRRPRRSGQEHVAVAFVAAALAGSDPPRRPQLPRSIDEFHERHHRAVPGPRPRPEDAAVAPLPLGVPPRDGPKQLRGRLLRPLQQRQGGPPRRQVALLGERDGLVREAAELLGLRERRLDALVLDELRDERPVVFFCFEVLRFLILFYIFESFWISVLVLAFEWAKNRLMEGGGRAQWRGTREAEKRVWKRGEKENKGVFFFFSYS